MAGVLVLVRHGQSEWNAKNLFTGWVDPGLSLRGVEEARAAGRLIREEGLSFDDAFTSGLRRAQITLALILEEVGQSELAWQADQALNERDYGELTGSNKDEARRKWGEKQVHVWRRSFDIPPPGGESLKDTAARVLPYYDRAIAPLLEDGRRVIVAAHGNSLRALVMRLEGISPAEIVKRELATGAPLIYRDP